MTPDPTYGLSVQQLSTAQGQKDKAPSGIYAELLATIIEHAKIDATIAIAPLARVIAELNEASACWCVVCAPAAR